MEKIRVYSTRWCSDCYRAKFLLNEYGVDYEEIDVEVDEAALALIERVNQGRRSVPTIIFPDGSIMVEPSTRELVARLDPEI